jgi:hypothetical protein
MIDTAVVNQFLVTADLNDAPAIEHHDFVRAPDGGMRWAITMTVRPVIRLASAFCMEKSPIPYPNGTSLRPESESASSSKSPVQWPAAVVARPTT